MKIQRNEVKIIAYDFIKLPFNIKSTIQRKMFFCLLRLMQYNLKTLPSILFFVFDNKHIHFTGLTDRVQKNIGNSAAFSREGKSTLPSKFNNLFFMNSQIHNCNTRNAHSFRLPLCRTNNRLFSIYFQGPKFYNSFNSVITGSSLSPSFERKLKQFFLSMY